jgi:hypothetical protein
MPLADDHGNGPNEHCATDDLRCGEPLFWPLDVPVKSFGRASSELVPQFKEKGV